MREELGIDDWLELVKEDKNLNGAYISFAQYMYLLEQENQELKSQIEELNKQIEERIVESSYFDMITDENISFKNQQKEFISYLENEIKNMNPKNLSIGEFNLENNDEKMLRYLTLKDNISKYKQIIGVSDENSKN